MTNQVQQGHQAHQVQCDALLLGREPVDGAVHSASLATLVRGLAGTKARPNRQGRRFLLRCSEAGVDLLARRPSDRLHRTGRHDDEGFESDDDRRSTRSDDSNSNNSEASSCCLVDDHVFKAAAAPPLPLPLGSAPVATSSTSSDSANSSGGSDTDEVDTAAIPVPKAIDVLVEPACAGATTTVPVPVPVRETFSFQDVAFCHVDAAFPRVVVLVVRRAAAPRRLRAGREPPAGGLEALVLECRSEESLRALCSSYQELSRRIRLDGQYRSQYPHRRKDYTSTASDEVRVKESATTKVTSANASAQPVGNGTLLPKFIFSKVDEISSDRSSTSSSGPASIASSATRDSDGSAVSRFNLVHRTDGDGVTHIEVSRGSVVTVDGQEEAAVNEEDRQDMCGPSSIISISTPDAGNVLLLSTAHAHAQSKDRTRINKEIEGVIRADVETASNSSSGRREAGFRQRQQPDVLEPKLWSTALAPRDRDRDRDWEEEPPSGPSSLPSPPQRPERKRFVRKAKAPAPPAPSASDAVGPLGVGVSTLKKKSQEVLNNTLNRQAQYARATAANARSASEQRVVRGQFIRVSVDQQQQQQQALQQVQPAGWISHFPAGWTGPPPSRSGTPNPGGPAWRRDMSVYQDVDQRLRYQRRSRSSDSGRGQVRTRSPPAVRRPMAYRYIDTPSPSPAPQVAATPRPHPSATTNSLSNRFFGLSQKLREIGGSVVGTGYHGGRRNSWGDSPTRFYTSLDPPLGGGKGSGSNNLKSVIKKSQAHAGGAEPKKVTFSAYATVQVVD